MESCKQLENKIAHKHFHSNILDNSKVQIDKFKTEYIIIIIIYIYLDM